MRISIVFKTQFFILKTNSYFLMMNISMSIESYIKTKLNDEQYASAIHIDTSALILAGA